MSAYQPARPTNVFQTVNIDNRPVWAKIFQPADQPAQSMNFTVRSLAVKSHPSPLRPTVRPVQPAPVAITTQERDPKLKS